MASNDPLDKLVIGYPKLAGHMEIQPEVAIFRRFAALNAKNLLYMQAELAYLEIELQECETADNQNPEGRKKKYGRSWYWLSQSKDDGDTKQLDLVLKMRRLLKEYNDALIQQSTVMRLGDPDKWDLENLQDFLGTARMDGNGSFPFLGEDAQTWGSTLDRKSHSLDLVGLCPRSKDDPFSEWVAKNAIRWLFGCYGDRLKKPSRIHGVVVCNDLTVFRITYWITSILASLVPITSIVALYNIGSMPRRLLVIGVFNVVLSVCLIAFTSAKRVEIFAVTAAFAAVQVVFVSAERSV